MLLTFYDLELSLIILKVHDLIIYCFMPNPYHDTNIIGIQWSCAAFVLFYLGWPWNMKLLATPDSSQKLLTIISAKRVSKGKQISSFYQA